MTTLSIKTHCMVVLGVFSTGRVFEIVVFYTDGTQSTTNIIFTVFDGP